MLNERKLSYVRNPRTSGRNTSGEFGSGKRWRAAANTAPSLSSLPDVSKSAVSYDFDRDLGEYSTNTESIEGMAEPSREEIDAKLSAVEARLETRYTELSGKLDRIGDSISHLSTSISTELAAVKSDNKFTRTTVIVAVVASLLAGIAALWTTQSNLLAAFQLGLTMNEQSTKTKSSQ